MKKWRNSANDLERKLLAYIFVCQSTLREISMTGRRGNWSNLEKPPEMNFRKIEELSHLSFVEKEKILSDVEYILEECELSKKLIMQECEDLKEEPDPYWLKRVNYKIGIKRAQKKLLQNHLRVAKGENLISCFYDIAKIMLPDETFEIILHKAKELQKKTLTQEVS